jgi:hypothetical protein
MDYAAFTSVTDNYRQYANVLLNSLDYHGHVLDFHLLAIDVPKSWIDQMMSIDWTFNLTIHHFELEMVQKMFDTGKNIASKKLRYFFLSAGLLKDYVGVVLLDADMFVVRNITPFFKMVANTDVILGVNERFKWYLDKYTVNNEGLPKRKMDWMICNAPLFFSPYKQARFIRHAFDNATAVRDLSRDGAVPSDLFTMNVSLFTSGAYENVVQLPHYAWTGVHIGYTDLLSRISKQADGMWYSWFGDYVYMIHGRWDRAAAANGYLKNTEKRYDELGLPPATKEKHRKQAISTLNQIRNEWMFFNSKHKAKWRG